MLELVQVNRRAGPNDVGMVAWLMVLKTVKYPEGRQVVLIANDITFKAGCFGTREDDVLYSNWHQNMLKSMEFSVCILLPTLGLELAWQRESRRHSELHSKNL